MLAFTRADLLAVVAVVILLGGWFAWAHLGERGRMARCASNLKYLGEGMSHYAADHGGGIPPAGVDAPQTTWDLQIARYLGAPVNAATAEQWPASVAARFACPSDPLHRGAHPRTYALTFHDMAPDNWPPGPDNATGDGLWWDEDSITALLGQATTNLDALSLVKPAWFPDPAGTILLTEFPDKANRLGHVEDVRVRNPGEQNAGLDAALARMHFGRFNYLMADGHVEWLSALQTGGVGGDTGSWTIKKGD